MTQEEALDVLKSGANVFLTGEPGSGKTHTVNQYVSYLRSCGVEPAITASTGIAATHIGGFTIHSWSGIGIKHELTLYDLDRIAQNERVARRVSHAHVLIIDEVSMLSAQVLSMVDKVCRVLRRSNRPMGGLQVVLVGDFFQLPPISRKINISGAAAELTFEDSREDAQALFAYHSSVWSELNLLTCYLSEQYRQEDQLFLDILSALRRGSITEELKERLLERRVKQDEPTTQAFRTKLFSHNVDVDRINGEELKKLAGDEHIFEMEERGISALVGQLKKSCISPERLALKVGARVMFTKNNIDGRYVNGTLGKVVGFSKDNGLPIVKTRSGRIIVVDSAEWSVENEGRVLAQIFQLPLRLAWAITVHKSQGMSLDAAVMDLSQAFEYGQGYVALSRVRTLEGLELLGLNVRALEVHPDILEKDAFFRDGSVKTREYFSSLTVNELNKMHFDFIRASGGKPPKVSVQKLKQKQLPKKDTRLATLELIKGGMGVAEAASVRLLTEDTIVHHLEWLKGRGSLNISELAHISKGKEDEFYKIHKALEEIGSEKLKPIFEHFDEVYPYSTIRLARLFKG